MSKKNMLLEKFDIRTLDFALSSEIVSQEELQKHLDSLPDDEGNYEIAEEIIAQADDEELEDDEESGE